MYQSGKGYKAISKALGLQWTTVRAIIHKWRKLVTVVNLPMSGWPTKITPRVQRRLIQEVIKEPRTTSKKLQASLASIKVSVHDSTIRKRLGKNGVHGRVSRQKPLLTKKNTKAFHTTFTLLILFFKRFCTHFHKSTAKENLQGIFPSISVDVAYFKVGHLIVVLTLLSVFFYFFERPDGMSPGHNPGRWLQMFTCSTHPLSPLDGMLSQLRIEQAITHLPCH